MDGCQRFVRFALGACLVVGVGLSASCTSSKSARKPSANDERTSSTTSNEQAQDTTALERAIPGRPLFVAKGKLEVLQAAPDTLFRGDVGSVRAIAERLLSDLLGARSDEAELSLDAVATDRTSYLAVGEPANAQVRNLLRAGGPTTMPLELPNVGPVIRLLLPTDDPQALASSIRDYCGTDDERPYCKSKSYLDVLDDHVAIGLRTDTLVSGTGAEFSETNTPIARRFGFEKAPAALQAFRGYDGPALYLPFEGIRKFVVLRSLVNLKGALDGAEYRWDASLRGQWLAQSPFVMDPADASEYVDAALLLRGASAPVGLDAVMSATDLAGAEEEEASGEYQVPVPSFESPVVEVVWPGPRHYAEAADHLDFDPSKPMFRHWRFLLASPYQKISLAEAPGVWWRITTRMVRERVELDDSDAPIAPPTAISAAVDADEDSNGETGIRAGFAATWETNRAPDAVLDAIVSRLEPTPAEGRTVETDGRTHLLIGWGEAPEAVFGTVDSIAAQTAHASVDGAALPDIARRYSSRELRNLARELGKLLGDSQLSVESGLATRGRTVELRWAETEQDGSIDRTPAVEQSGYQPAADGQKWRRCRSRHVRLGSKLAYAMERSKRDAVTRRRSKTVDRVDKLMTKCAKRHSARATRFRRAAASWRVWKGARARAECRYSDAVRDLESACDDDYDSACRLRETIGPLEGWNALPTSPLVGIQESVHEFGWYRAGRDIRIHRNGAAAVHAGPKTEQSGRFDDVQGAADRIWELIEPVCKRYRDSVSRADSGDLVPTAPPGADGNSVVAPDALVELGTLEPLVELRRREDCVRRIEIPHVIRGKRLSRSNSTVGTFSLQHLDRDHSEEAPDEPDGVARIDRSGVELTVDGEPLDPPDRCDDGRFCLREGRDAIDDAVDDVRKAFEADDDADEALTTLVELYPLGAIRSALDDVVSDSRSFIRIEVAADVPITVVPGLVTALRTPKEDSERTSERRQQPFFESYRVDIVEADE